MDAPEERIAPNMFHPFTVLDNRLQAGLKGMVREEQERIRREGPEALNGELKLKRSRLAVIAHEQTSQP
jgi:hypothetical protein